MPSDKSRYKRGTLLEGGACPGAFVKPARPLPRDLEHFEETVKAAGPLLGAPGFDEIEQRLAEARERLEDIRRAVKQK